MSQIQQRFRRIRTVRQAASGCVLALLMLAAVAPAGAQDIQFRQLGPDDGLSSFWVPAIFQDTRGFMWFGTSNGLTRYDGYSFVVYRHQRSDSTSLSDNYVSVVYEDRQNRLWAGTKRGLSLYDRARDQFSSFMLHQDTLTGQRRQVTTILEDSHGTFWVGTSAGLTQFDRITSRETAVSLPGTRHPFVQAIVEDSRGDLWIGTEADGLLTLDRRSGAVTRHLADPASPLALAGTDIRDISEDSSGVIWIGSYGAGVTRFDPATGTVRRYRHDPLDSASLTVDRVLKVLVDRVRGGVWVGTENGGVNYLDPETGTFSHATANARQRSRLNDTSIWSLYQDASDALWVGTFSGGVNVSRQNGSAIRLHQSIVGDEQSLSINSVRSFSDDRHGMVWVATDGGGLNRFDPVTRRFQRYTTANSALSHNAVLATAADSAGGVWVGMWGGGISYRDDVTGEFTSYNTDNSNLPDDNVFAVHVDRRERLWVGTWREGLALFDRKSESFTTYPIANPDVPQSQIWLIREMADGRLILGTPEQGMRIFDPATGSMVAYTSDPADFNSLSSDNVRAAVETEPGIVWVGTVGGLDRLDTRTGTIRSYTEADGLPSRSVAGLAQDRRGKLWISTDRGISVFDPATASFRNYSPADDLQGWEFNPATVGITRDGTIYFGGNNGFNTINPELLVENQRRPAVVLTGFQLFNKPVAIGADGSPLEVAISETRELVLTHAQSVFTFEFAALDFTAPEKNRYAYMLEGFDHDWNEVGTSRTATYTNISPGEYVFRVKASNNDGVWNEAGVALPITILPPYWQTWWFRMLIWLVFASVSIVCMRGARQRRRRLEAMNLQLAEAAERDRAGHEYLDGNVREMLDAMQRFAKGDHSVELSVDTEDEIGRLRAGFNTVVADRKRAEDELRQSQKMEAVGRLAGGVAHDFNNLLTVIKGNAELALMDPDTTMALRGDLEEVHRAADRASGLTQQLLAYSRKQILQPRNLSLNAVVGDIARMLHRTVGEDVTLSSQLAPGLWTVQADPGQVEQVLLNLVVNARDAMPRGGQLVIRTRNVPAAAVPNLPGAQRLPYVSLSVTDTGEGMDASVREQAFEPFFTTKPQGKGTGLGLATVYGIISQSGGFVQLESELGRGSTFTVYLPRVESEAMAEDDSQPARSSGGSEAILVVEDEASVRLLTTRALERHGYTVLSAASGAAAMEVSAAYAGEIHLLLTDVVMPGMSGRELAEQLLPKRPGMRLLYASGYTEDAIVRHGVSGRSAAFLEKPFTLDGLAHKVREVLSSERGEYEGEFPSVVFEDGRPVSRRRVPAGVR